MKKGVDFIGVGCGAMVFDNGLVFLAKRGEKCRNEKGLWDFPGGGVRFGETCEEAVTREIKEEYDLDIEVTELLEVIDHIIPKEGQHWVSPSFIAKKIGGTAKNMEPEKCSEFKWVKLSEINPEALSAPSKSNYFKYIQKYGLNAPNFA